MPIFCINLKHRQDRKQHSLSQFKNLGLSEKDVIYPTFIKDGDGGIYGCYDSHVKVWKEFYIFYPNQTYALVFEDDFMAPSNGLDIIKQAIKCIQEKDVDILFLHNLCVPVENCLNNQLFTNGYGLGSHAYVISRRYIERILDKYGTFPEATGHPLDNEQNFNTDKENKVYSEKLFYTTQPCFTQQISKSDINISYIERLFKNEIIDRDKGVHILVAIIRFLKKYNVLTDKDAKKIYSYLSGIFLA